MSGIISKHFHYPARNKDFVVVVTHDNNGPFKGVSARLLDGLNARYSHAQGGYVISLAKFKIFEKASALGYSAKIRFGKDKSVFTKDGRELTYLQLKKELDNEGQEKNENPI